MGQGTPDDGAAVMKWLADLMCRTEETLVGHFGNSLSRPGVERLRAVMAAEAEMAALRKALGRPFLTGHSGCEGGPFVKLKYETLAESQQAHEALVRLFRGA